MADNNNAYIISEVGKPPEFAMEMGSVSTCHTELVKTRQDYASMGVTEFWQYDPTGGCFQGAALIGNRLENGVYISQPIEQLEEEVWQGYSPVLKLYLRWVRGELIWYDPATGKPIAGQQDPSMG